MNQITRRVEQFLNITSELGCELDDRSSILDFGCGNGDIVNEYARRGYKAFGCDIGFKDGAHLERLRNEKMIRLIESQPYKLPFEDNYFDLVVSDQVFEHVSDYSSALQEINRVLKPGGFSMHIFPSKYRVVETHVRVPFASIIQSYWWLLMWAYIGAKKNNERGIPCRQIARKNYDYLHDHTNYLSAREIRKHVCKYYRHILFCEEIFLKYSQRGSIVYALSKYVPVLPKLYSTFSSRVIAFRK
jgi:ubiquinone/menaquinone biosynthesis C-methylase UbiE